MSTHVNYIESLSERAFSSFNNITDYKEKSIVAWANYSHGKVELTDALKASLSFKVHCLSQLFFSLKAISKFAVLMLLRPLKDFQIGKSFFLVNPKEGWEQITLCGALFAATFNLDKGLFSNANMASYTDALSAKISEALTLTKKVDYNELLSLHKVLITAANRVMISTGDIKREFNSQALSSINEKLRSASEELTSSVGEDSAYFQSLAQMHIKLITDYENAQNSNAQVNNNYRYRPSFDNYKWAVDKYKSLVDLMTESSTLFEKVHSGFEEQGSNAVFTADLFKRLQMINSSTQTINQNHIEAKPIGLEICKQVACGIILSAGSLFPDFSYDTTGRVKRAWIQSIDQNLTQLSNFLESISYYCSLTKRSEELGSQMYQNRVQLKNQLAGQYVYLLNISVESILKMCCDFSFEKVDEEVDVKYNKILSLVEVVKRFSSEAKACYCLLDGEDDTLKGDVDLACVLTFVEGVKAFHNTVNSQAIMSVFEKFQEEMSSKAKTYWEEFCDNANKLYVAAKTYDSSYVEGKPKAEGKQSIIERFNPEITCSLTFEKLLTQSLPNWKLPFDIDTSDFINILMNLNCTNDSSIGTAAIAEAGAGAGAGAGVALETGRGVRPGVELAEQIALQLLKKYEENRDQYFNRFTDNPDEILYRAYVDRKLFVTATTLSEGDSDYSIIFDSITNVYKAVMISETPLFLAEGNLGTLYKDYLEALSQFDLSAAKLVSACLSTNRIIRAISQNGVLDNVDPNNSIIDIARKKFSQSYRNLQETCKVKL